MKKIDLHIHTVATICDVDFVFDLQTLRHYVSEAGLDAIAITNHNLFDGPQYSTIVAALDIVVFPGIEVTVDGTHVLVIIDKADLGAFVNQAAEVSALITSPDASVGIADLLRIFPDSSGQLVIPHYQKTPAIRPDMLRSIADCVVAGEVDSPKKFIKAIKDQGQLTPVLFSDARISGGMSLPTRQTYIDCGDLTLSAIKACLRDKQKVALSRSEGNELFQVFEDGQQLSTGLNVVVGARSSGKTHTLNKIHSSSESVKYIKQFDLVRSQADDERSFATNLQRDQSRIVEDYLAGFKKVLIEMMSVDVRVDDREIANYMSSLKQSAEMADRNDIFSNAALFDESAFSVGDDAVLCQLIESVRQVVENVEYRDIIEKYVDRDSLRALAVELIDLLWTRALDAATKRIVNQSVSDIKAGLNIRTSAVQVQDLDLYRIMLNKKRVERFCEIVKSLQEDGVISEQTIQGFRVVSTKGPFTGAGEVKSESRTRLAFAEAYSHYDRPYEYLRSLLDIEALPQSDIYRLFSKITYSILNRDGYPVSGGERSEFRLLQEIQDAQNYDLLLIDEPESSFDNMFLKSDVNQMIREIAETMPVVVVTHNNTVGASSGADYVLYTAKEIDQGQVKYRIYSGYPTDSELRTVDGKDIRNHEVALNTLEAGSEAYKARREVYEAIRDM